MSPGPEGASNDPAGFDALLDWLGSNVAGGQQNVHVCMEATGVYHESLALFLHDHGVAVSVVNPMLVKRFVESEGVRSKTDSADAKALARYAERTRPRTVASPFAWREKAAGGPQLLAYIGRPERFKNVKALTAYAGLAPLIQQSGTSLNKKRGTHPLGSAALRHALYFPAMVAGKYNPVIARFWQRLKAQNKPGKVIVVACMHKLLAIAYGVLKSGKPFDPTMQLPAGA